MNYSELIDAAKTYADRQDVEVNNNIDVFVLMAEARINRKLKIREQTHRVYTQTFENQEYYALPEGYVGMRSLTISDKPPGAGGNTVSLIYLPPNDFNAIDEKNYDAAKYYTIVSNQIRIYPAPAGGSIEIIFYRKVTNLTKDNPTNWLSEDHPDIYLAGLMAEIESFVKNYDAATLWDNKMSRSIDELEESDVEARWSGSALQMQVEHILEKGGR